MSMALITDLHHDIMHDGRERLQAFVDFVKRRKPDAVMQLGDFAYPNEKNKDVIGLFNTCHATRLHVIGNHDTDLRHTHAQCVTTWGMPAPYYAQTVNGIRMIVLNGNEHGSPTHKGGYPAYIGKEQAAWLAKELNDGTLPVIIISHQPLTGFYAVDNATDIQQQITAARHRVIMAINGHTHVDSLQYVDDIPYLTINSASYFWVGEQFKHNSYTPEIHAAHPWISSTCPYKDPLFTVLTIDPDNFTIRLESRKSEWVGKSPAALGFTDKQPLRTGEEIVPFIRPYKLSVQQRMKRQRK